MRTNRRQTMLRYGVFSFVLLLLLSACGESHEEMLRQLTELERMNRADSVMLNVTLAEQLTRYFDRHGSANERMRAHYILGRTYADMGNSPDALKTYHTAIDKCDTLSKDFDFILLSKIFGQMAGLYAEYKLHHHSLSANQSASHFAMRGKDTLSACIFMEYQVSDYCNLGLKDSALTMSNRTVRLFEEIGDTLAANCSLAPVIMIYAERKDYSKMKELLDKYEFHSPLFGNDSLKYENQYLLYYYKGLFYTGVRAYDSAAISLHRLLGKERSLNNQFLGAKGLYNLYNDIGLPDSVVYYANLHTALNDSIANLLEHSLVYNQQMFYNYSQHQQHALEMEQLANKERYRGIIIIAVSLIIILLLLFFRWQNVQKMRQYKVKMIAYRQMQQKKDAEEKGLEKNVDVYSQFPYNTDIRKRLLDKVSQNDYATDKDWEEANRVILKNCPGFNDTLQGFLPSINSTNFRICLGIKLRFTPVQTAILVSRSKQAVTSARSRMYKDVFGKKGKPSDFDAFIFSIS